MRLRMREVLVGSYLIHPPSNRNEYDSYQKYLKYSLVILYIGK
jgi:hypothetical protein